MDRRTFSRTALSAFLSAGALPAIASVNTTHTIRLLRHATLVVETGNINFLVDPMLSPKGAMDPVPNAGNDTRIPMVDLPIGKDELVRILNMIDAVLVTHTHRDHWDAAAQEMISKDKPIFCQATDLEKIKGQGFTNVTAVEHTNEFKGVLIHRTAGQHGTGEIGQRMGVVSGFVLQQQFDKVYIAGDTILCPEVEAALKQFEPTTTVVNCGGAQFLTGGPITMTAQDVVKVAARYPDMNTIAVHMDTINHCKVTRQVLSDYMTANSKKGLIAILADGGRI